MQTRLEIYVIKYHECEPHGFHSCGASGKSAVTNISIQHIHVSIDMCHGVCTSHSLLRCLSPTVTLYFSLVLPSRVLRCKNTMPHDIHIPGLTLTRLSTYTKRTPMTPPPHFLRYVLNQHLSTSRSPLPGFVGCFISG